MADKGKDKLLEEESSSSTRRHRREIAATDTQFMAYARTAARTARAPRPSMTAEEQEENDLFTAQLMSMMDTFEQLAKNPRMQKLLKTKDYTTGSQAETSQQATSRQRQVTESVERVPTVVTGPVQHAEITRRLEDPNAFHVSLLRPFVGEVPEEMVLEEQPEVEELDEILIPEQILAHKVRKVKGKVARRYLVKFKNYSPMDAKWMEEAESADSPQLLQLYKEAFLLESTVT
ncbi:hypothetical protein L7F22_017520 [Adiantum nelumboides]|nr:hypothetical protein [Adiantum nelumboides]